ncbi:acylase [soil metagenome]
MKRIALFLLLFAQFSAWAQIDVSRIDIVRDNFGVPHIFAPTDEEVAYGLAWATGEDDFKTTQELLLVVRGMLGEVNGKNGAILDFMYYILDVDHVVEEKYETSYSDKFKKVLNYYAQGLNAYALAHPEELLSKKLFPITEKDLVKSYTLTIAMLANVYIDIQKIFGGWIAEYEGSLPDGSNAFAYNSKKTTDGKAYLIVNSHQPLEGLFSWYEVHVCSEEGWNFLGGTFPGGCAPFLGTNENLGWAATLNHPDFTDVYKLQMHPTDKLKYKFDDKWETLEPIDARVKVKVGCLKIPIKKTFYRSKYGPTIKNDDGYYSLRFASGMGIKAPEQTYRMNKARNYTEFMEAMRMQGHSCTNLIYADREDNIYFISNGLFPKRDPKYNWKDVLPGNTSKTLWSDDYYYPLDSLPQYLNPKSGYLFNSNNTPFNATGPLDNLKQDKFNPTFGYEMEDNNRSIRAQELIGKYDKISYEDAKKIKYDNMFNPELYTYGCENLGLLVNLDPTKYPDIADAIAVGRDWNFSSDVNNQEAALLFFAFYEIAAKMMESASQYECNAFYEEEYVAAMRHAKKHMLKHFGTLRIPLGDVQKLVRGDKVLPIGGGPDALGATLSEPYKNGMRKSQVGDSYIMMCQYSKDGVEIETIHNYGASAKPDSPHYNDQMEMFVRKEFKPMTLDKATIYRDAKSIYHPGPKGAPTGITMEPSK